MKNLIKLNLKMNSSKSVTKHKLIKLANLKNRGTMSSMIYGTYFMLLLAVWTMFSYRLTLINAMFDYIDDSLTSSTLGMAIVNTEEYGKTHQLVIHDNQKIIDNDSAPFNNVLEEKILNSNGVYTKEYINATASSRVCNASSKTNTANDATIKKSLNSLMNNLAANLSNGMYSGKFDFGDSNIYSLKNINTSDFIVNESGKYSQTTFNNSGVAETNTTAVNIEGNLAITNDKMLKNSIFGNFLVGDIEVSQVRIYNVYRATLARLYTYQFNQEWFNVRYENPGESDVQRRGEVVNVYPRELNTYDWKDRIGYNEGIDDASVTEPKHKDGERLNLDSLDNFDKLYKPSQIVWGDRQADGTYAKVENPNYGYQLAEYIRNRQTFYEQLEIYNGHQYNCYIDTNTTYQGKWTWNKAVFNNFYTYNKISLTPDQARKSELLIRGGSAAKPTYNFTGVGTVSVTCTPSIVRITKDLNTKLYLQRAPIVGVGVYSFGQKSGNTTDNAKNYSYVTGNTTDNLDSGSYNYYTVGTTPTNNLITKWNKNSNQVFLADYNNTASSFIIGNCKSAGAELNTTSVYVELTFTVKTSPSMSIKSEKEGMLLNNNYKKVTISRLIDIDINE